MRSDIVSNSKFFARRRKAPSGPLRTFTEIAEEFGLKPKQLSGLLGTSVHNPPNPVFKNHCRNTGKVTWYDPQEMRAWWKRHNEAGKP